MTEKQVSEFAEFVRARSQLPSALPRPSGPGELRPNIATMRALDMYWGPGNLLERTCAALTYSHAATFFDPMSFTVEEWAQSEDPSEYLGSLPGLLSRAANLLIEVRPLVESAALDLVPPALTRDFARDIPEFQVEHSLLDRYHRSGITERIGAFNQELGGSHLTGRFRGYQHLWEIHQDLLLVDRYPGVLQPLFSAGFDAELASLLMTRSPMSAVRHVEALAAFRFPILQVTPKKVSELRALDDLSSWRESLQSALAASDPDGRGVSEAQAFVAETLGPTAERLVKSLKTRWGDIRWAGIEQLVIGGLTAGVALQVGADPAVATGTGAANAALRTVWTGWRARGQRTTLDVPFLSMFPDNDRNPPLAIPKMGLL